MAEDEPNFLAGAKVYKDHCAVCHGLPGEPKTVIAAGMFPKPPQLFQGMGVTDDEAWETYWKVANGIRMTGMPGFKERLSEKQMWQVSVLVKNADKIPPSVKAELAPAVCRRSTWFRVRSRGNVGGASSRSRPSLIAGRRPTHRHHR